MVAQEIFADPNILGEVESWVDVLVDRFCGKHSEAAVGRQNIDAVLKDLKVPESGVVDKFLEYKPIWSTVAGFSQAVLNAAPLGFGQPLAIILGVIYNRAAQVDF
jgi:hypothetical protein